MKKFIFPLSIVSVFATASACSQGNQESWARQIFAPSTETLKTACGLAFEYPSNITIGEIRLSTSSGQNLYFKSPIFSHYGLCQVGHEPAQSREEFLSSDTYKSYKNSTFQARPVLLLEPKGGYYSEEDYQTTVALVLNDATGKEVLQLKPKPLSIPMFEFDLVAVQEQPKLDSVKSFTIVLTNKTKVEKLSLDPTKFTAFEKVKNQ
jgi:hypothetical protein